MPSSSTGLPQARGKAPGTHAATPARHRLPALPWHCPGSAGTGPPQPCLHPGAYLGLPPWVLSPIFSSGSCPGSITLPSAPLSPHCTSLQGEQCSMEALLMGPAPAWLMLTAPTCLALNDAPTVLAKGGGFWLKLHLRAGPWGWGSLRSLGPAPGYGGLPLFASLVLPIPRQLPPLPAPFAFCQSCVPYLPSVLSVRHWPHSPRPQPHSPRPQPHCPRLLPGGSYSPSMGSPLSSGSTGVSRRLLRLPR